MLATGLKLTDARAVDYFQESFARDLALVAGDVPDSEPARLSVASFVPNYPKDTIYCDPACRFATLAEQRWFLASFFVGQLLSQASHFARTPVSVPGPPVVLVGLLSSYWSIVHPGFLLLVLGMYQEAALDPDLHTGLGDLLRLHLSLLPNPDVATGFQDTMLAAMADGEMPDSLRAFVPRGDAYRYRPDVAAVLRWRNAVLAALAARAA